MISIICCYNNKTVYNDFLLKSINNCNYSNCEIIGLDNSNCTYSSISQAYNYALSQIKGDWIFFCHQDVAFERDFFKEMEKYLNTQNKDQVRIFGFAGITDDGTVYSNIQRRNSREYIIRNQITKETNVISLDECCFIVSKNTMDKLGYFDEKVCNNWHMYCVELCLRSLINGGSNICLPDIIYHKDGKNQLNVTLDKYFLGTAYRVSKKYKNNFDVLYTPCYKTSTKSPFLEIKILRSLLKYLFVSVKKR